MRSAETFTWTDTQVEVLKTKWAAGMSASDIAAQFGGGLTRSAVLGKVHRLKLKQREKMVPAKARMVVQPAVAKARGGIRYKIGVARQNGLHGAEAMEAVLGKPEPLALGDAIPAAGGLVRLETLGQHDCRWPFGDPLTKDFGFCGDHVAEGEVYCHAHCRKAYLGWQP